jgi:hypothetical protein
MRVIDALKFFNAHQKDAVERGFNVKKLDPSSLLLPMLPHQFAASVLLRYYSVILRDFKNELLVDIEYDNEAQSLAFKFNTFHHIDGFAYEVFYCNINPFVHMVNHDGSPRTSCTELEFTLFMGDLPQ